MKTRNFDGEQIRDVLHCVIARTENALCDALGKRRAGNKIDQANQRNQVRLEVRRLRTLNYLGAQTYSMKFL